MLNQSGDTVGEILKRAREAKDLSIEDVNRSTKISVHVIKSLEQDDLDSFASETYLKGFLRNYAAFLGLDADQVWSMLNRKRGDTPAAKGTFWDIEEAVQEEKLRSPRIFKRFVLPAILIVIVVLVVLLVREKRKVKQLTTGALTHYVIDRGQV
jgi:cytoskeletal protein RodZ